MHLDLPDGRFATSMHSQISHLLMGIVHDGARPGDPTSYPFPWLRDEAYVVVALPAAAIWPSQKSYRRGWPKMISSAVSVRRPMPRAWQSSPNGGGKTAR